MRVSWALVFGTLLVSASPLRAAPVQGFGEDALGAGMASAATVYFERGQRHERKGRLHQAAQEYERAIRLDEEYAEAHNQLGYVRRRMGLYDQAIASYKRAIELNPKMAEAHEYLAHAYASRGDFAAARAELATLRKLDKKLAKDLATAIDEAERAARAKAEAEAAEAERKRTPSS